MHIIRSMPIDATVPFHRKGDSDFPFKGLPERANLGDLYFIAHHGKIAGVGRINHIEPPGQKHDLGYLQQGQPIEPERYSHIIVGKIQRRTGSPPYEGHTGIRYVDELKDARLRAFLTKAAENVAPAGPVTGNKKKRSGKAKAVDFQSSLPGNWELVDAFEMRGPEGEPNTWLLMLNNDEKEMFGLRLARRWPDGEVEESFVAGIDQERGIEFGSLAIATPRTVTEFPTPNSPFPGKSVKS